MQAVSLLRPLLLNFEWTNLNEKQEIRIMENGIIAYELTEKLMIDSHGFLTRRQTLAVLHKVQLLLRPSPSTQPVGNDKKVNDIAQIIHAKLREKMLSDAAQADRVETEFLRLVACIEKQFADKRVLRAPAPRDQIVQYNPAGADVNKPAHPPLISPKDEAWLKWFSTIASQFTEIPSLFTEEKGLTESIQLLKEKNEPFQRELNLRKELRQKIAAILFPLIKTLFKPVHTAEDGITLCENLDTLRLKYKIDHIQFAQALIQGMADDQIALLIEGEIRADIEKYRSTNLLFRQTSLFSQALVGGFLVKLAHMTICPVIDQHIAKLEQLNVSPDAVNEYFLRLLEDIKTQFCKCTFTPPLIHLFKCMEEGVRARFKESGIAVLIASYFLRGVNSYIVDCSRISPFERTLVVLAKLNQNAIRDRLPQIQEMERYIDLQIRKYDQGM